MAGLKRNAAALVKGRRDGSPDSDTLRRDEES
jgi:hypothetical protein